MSGVSLLRDTSQRMTEESTTPDLVELTHQVFVAATNEDLDATTAHLAPDAALEMGDVLGPLEGLAAIRAFLTEWWSMWEDHHHYVEEILDLGHGVVYAVIREDGRVKGSAEQVEARLAHVILWIDGLIVRDTAYASIDEARAAAERLAESRG